MGKGRKLVSYERSYHENLNVKTRVLFTGYSGIPDDYVLVMNCYSICVDHTSNHGWVLSVRLRIDYGNASADFLVLLDCDDSRDVIQKSADSLMNQFIKGVVPTIYIDSHDLFYNEDLVEYTRLRCAAEKFIDEQLDRHPSDILII